MRDACATTLIICHALRRRNRNSRDRSDSAWFKRRVASLWLLMHAPLLLLYKKISQGHVRESIRATICTMLCPILCAAFGAEPCAVVIIKLRQRPLPRRRL